MMIIIVDKVRPISTIIIVDKVRPGIVMSR